MADIIDSLEIHLSLAAGISSKIREHVQRIDRYTADVAIPAVPISGVLTGRDTPAIPSNNEGVRSLVRP